MAQYFNEHIWSEALKNSDWYIRLADDYRRCMAITEKADPQTRAQVKEEIYGFFEDKLASGQVMLASKGPDWDKERSPVDTVVIHHTKNSSGMTWERLNAIHLVRLYAGYYLHPREHEKQMTGKPLWSGHFRGDQQVFYAYHWLVRRNGDTERLLADTEIGWHAGDWDVNRRSVAICLDDDLEGSEPSHAALVAIARLAREHYGNVSRANIYGHREINPNTACPGDLFLDGWKRDMLGLIYE